MSEKAALRTEARKQLRALSAQAKQAAAEKLASRFFAALPVDFSPAQAGEAIALFRARPSDELPLEEALAPGLLALGFRLVFPRLVGDRLAWVAPPRGAPWPYAFQPGEKGTEDLAEPSEPLSPQLIRLVLAPGLAWDTHGSRLGRGAGFYDRFFADHPQPLRIALALEEQIVEKLPADPWDAPMDWVLSPARQVFLSPRMRSVLSPEQP